MELHTFSSLNADFLPQYKGCMASADQAVVFSIRKLYVTKITGNHNKRCKKGFAGEKLEVFTDNSALLKYLSEQDYTNTVLLIMTSGNFSGIDIKTTAEKLLHP